MTILVAPNAFKGCLTAEEAAQEMALGIRRFFPRAAIDLMPISDGGDGLMDVLLAPAGGRRISRRVIGPLRTPRLAQYALLSDGRTAVIEMARASGIAGIPSTQLDPFGATSYGTGELIGDAIERGARRIVVGMGGSATNDGGAGMAAALGAKFFDVDGKPLPLGAEPLRWLARIDARGVKNRLRGVEVLAVSDVTNPLLGTHGSARVYGPQKGASPAMVRVLDKALARYAKVIRHDVGVDVGRTPGTGAAGGLGAGLLAFLGAKIVPGADWVLDQLGADRRIRDADAVFTGEGKLDDQSFYGKAPIALARRAFRQGVPVVFISGQVARKAAESIGRIARHSKTRSNAPRFLSLSLTDPGENPVRAIRNAKSRLMAAAQQAVERVFPSGTGKNSQVVLK